MPIVAWPKGYVDLYHQILVSAKVITNGSLLAIDPSSGSSSPIGYAQFQAGVLIASGVINVPKGQSHRRLNFILMELSTRFPEVDVLVIEQLQGRMGSGKTSRPIARELYWAVGTTIAAIRAKRVFEVPLNVWKAHAKADPTYVKTDQKDAEAMGKSIIMIAKNEIEL